MSKLFIAFVLGLALCQVAHTASYAAVKAGAWGVAPNLVVSGDKNDTSFRKTQIAVGGQNLSAYVVAPHSENNVFYMKQRQFNASNITFVNSTDSNDTLTALANLQVEGTTITTQDGYVAYATQVKTASGKSNVYLYKKKLNATKYDDVIILTTNQSVNYQYTVITVFEVSQAFFVAYRATGDNQDLILVRGADRNNGGLTTEGVIVNLTNFTGATLGEMVCSDINALIYIGCAFTMNTAASNSAAVYYTSFTTVLNYTSPIQTVAAGYSGYVVTERGLSIARGNNFVQVLWVNTTNASYVVSSSSNYMVMAFEPNTNKTTQLLNTKIDTAVSIWSAYGYFNGYVIFYRYRSTSSPPTYKTTYQAYTRDNKINGTEVELVDGVTFFKTAIADNWAIYGLFDNGTLDNGVAVGRIFNNTYGTALQMFLGLIAFMIGAIFFI